ncbi:hypothetical protein SAMN05660337_0266 [Maridesulfovibrio ferrireducens]|uniref:Uncharacterized protein n=1 Tax=Maridesulfovibrio ferrireducens TaxID=246191 RepID=A0A1G9BEK1_9BACT|nr:hypothetical protein [Maridesulfovibrio ferrireducens]SDK37901.1 hypothetical protein SAMN05660337_0266 [Maridesulfovibrio ferrireducens]
MTQTTSISSMNKRSFLKKAFKGFSTNNSTNQNSERNSILPASNKLHNNKSESFQQEEV